MFFSHTSNVFEQLTIIQNWPKNVYIAKPSHASQSPIPILILADSVGGFGLFFVMFKSCKHLAFPQRLGSCFFLATSMDYAYGCKWLTDWLLSKHGLKKNPMKILYIGRKNDQGVDGKSTGKKYCIHWTNQRIFAFFVAFVAYQINMYPFWGLHKCLKLS